jgi:3-phosphoinositide dependent protein kinase-1
MENIMQVSCVNLIENSVCKCTDEILYTQICFLTHFLFFAVKVCDKRLILREKKQEYIKREKEALHKLKQTPGSISLVETFQSPSKLFFVTNLCKHGEILNYLQFMSLGCAKFYAAQLLVAIEGIHKQKIIHRDLKV